MPQTSFRAYYTARMLDSLSDEDLLSSAFTSSDIKIYPFQIAASAFALRSPYRKGAVLCDEAGMGKSHEAMLVITQKWLEGCGRILLLTPNADLLRQWTELIDLHYTIPYMKPYSPMKENFCRVISESPKIIPNSPLTGEGIRKGNGARSDHERV